MKVFESKHGRTLTCRLSYEADLLNSIKLLAIEKKIDAGVFFMLGAIKTAKFCDYDQKRKSTTMR